MSGSWTTCFSWDLPAPKMFRTFGAHNNVVSLDVENREVINEYFYSEFVHLLYLYRKEPAAKVFKFLCSNLCSIRMR